MIKKVALLAISFFDYFHQKKIIKFLKNNNLINIGVFFDVGAHKGESINLFLKELIVKKIISFEASSINFEFLKKNKGHYIKKYPNTKILIENIALGSENKKIFFNQFDESSSSTFNNINKQSKYFKRKFNLLNFFDKSEIYKSFEVKIQTLDQYMEINNLKRINFIKIDTEGYEYEILKGLKNKIRYVDIIMFEHHYNDMIKKNYTFTDINALLKINSFVQIYKSKMPFRKTFEYIYQKKEL
ncbi:FkbM family methyltransferase [Candidatus Pelagibacter sp.]|jgi:FkbM family methyltransferase|nr:FkbM family methyltransferase [Candidatus Pelagibacter sp.]